MMSFRSRVACTAFTLAVMANLPCFAVDTAKKPNVLFIAVDDLNDWIGCLGGHPQAKTPNIDALAGRGVNFAKAYCASPVCNPSRTALMCGLRSSTSGVYSNDIDRRTTICNDLEPLNSVFHKNGYYVAGAGKIYHGDSDRFGIWDDYSKGGNNDFPPGKGENDGVGGIKFAPADKSDEESHDYATVTYCIEQLNKKHDKPFFLACGLHKPHMAWNVPRKYYDMFPLESIILPEVLESDLQDVPPSGVKMARADGDHADILKSGRWKEAVRGYLAAGAYCDAMVGRLMTAFDKSPNRENTIIVFWGDHGWHLGEKQHWRKFSLWEEATRAPLFYTVPGMTKPNSVCQRTVDFMSIYPTLCELCSLERPKHVEGKSVVPLLKNASAPWEHAALTTHGFKNHGVRTEKWRYIRYENGDEELYDEMNDPKEWKNLANDPKFASVKADLAKFLPETNVPTPSKKVKADKKNKDKKDNKKIKQDKVK
jgi:iduronate 2-sulfatase